MGLQIAYLRLDDLILDCNMRSRVWRHEREEENEARREGVRASMRVST